MKPTSFRTALIQLALISLFSASAGADCFEYRHGSDTRVLRDMKQRDIDTIKSTIMSGYHSGFSSDTDRHYYMTKPVWVPANGFLVVQMGARFEPQIIVDNGRNNLGYSDIEQFDGKFHYATLHISGQDAHRNNDGYVNIVFTSNLSQMMSDYEVYRGEFSAWISLIEYQPGSGSARFVQVSGGERCDVQPSKPPASGTPQPGGGGGAPDRGECTESTPWNCGFWDGLNQR